MDPSFDLYFDDAEENVANLPRIRRHIRDHSNPLELPNAKFISYFRLNKDAFRYVLDEIQQFFKTPERSTSIPPILKLCAALRFIAEGSYQKCSGNVFNLGLAQPTISVVLKEVVDVMERKICPKWIKFEMTEEEKNVSKIHFFEQSGFPGVIGCVDGTHVRIISPKKELQHLYLNRKGYYSLNVMIVCDYKMNVRYVDARYAGCNHDSFIWNSSALKESLQNLGENTWILGNAGYPLQPFLMTPFRSTESGSPEARYNLFHAKARNIVERTIGVLKSRFRCLLSSRAMHLAPAKATKVVNVCCALHNVVQHFNADYLPEDTEIDGSEEIFYESHTGSNEESRNAEIARTIRNNIMHSL